MKATIFVTSGEVWAVKENIVLKSDGIGSCVVIVAYDLKKRIGALAHVMLPGRSVNVGMGYNTKYAHDAIEDMFFKMTRLGAAKGSIGACLVGGGNVLRCEDDTLCNGIINSVTSILGERGVRVVVKAMGGTLRRSVSLDIGNGAAHYSEGDGDTKLLYQWES